MIHAYDEILLGRAENNLGRMIDFSVHSLHTDADSMMHLFITSNISSLFERGSIRVLCGMSGIELAYYVMEKSGLKYERISPRIAGGLSSEYWAGHTLALIQWETSLPFSEIIRCCSASVLISEHQSKRYRLLESLPFDISSEEKSCALNSFGKDFASEQSSAFQNSSARSLSDSHDHCTNLKKLRTKNGLSQSQLAKAAGVPVRTIQQYEQRQKDLGKARAEYLIALSAALHCEASALLDLP